MLHSSGLNNNINRIHERALRITYNDKSPSCGELPNKGSSVAIITKTEGLRQYKYTKSCKDSPLPSLPTFKYSIFATSVYL